MSRLCDLPQELVVRCASTLTTPDLGALRRSCKHIERMLFDSFAREFFSRRQLMIEYASLEAFVSIAKHPGLSLYVTEVIINTQGFTHSESVRRSLVQGCPDRSHINITGLARDMLTEAFSTLPNLRAVGLRDYIAIGHSRGSRENSYWKPWGWAYEAYDTRNERPTHWLVLSAHDPGPVFSLLLTSLAGARSNIATVDVILRHDQRLQPQSFLWTSHGAQKSIPRLLSGLRVLNLALQLASDQLASDDTREGDARARYLGPLRKFLSSAERLQSLRLNFGNNGSHTAWNQSTNFKHSNHVKDLMDWLGTPVTPSLDVPVPALPGLEPSVALSYLTSLQLGKVYLEISTIVKVFAKFDLVSFTLWDMSIISGTTHCGIETWQELLRSLGPCLSDSSRLSQIKFGRCGQVADQVLAVDRIFFAPADVTADEVPKLPAQAVSDEARYAASRTNQTPRDWLKELEGRIWVKPVAEKEEEDEEDEGNDDDENEYEDEDDDGELDDGEDHDDEDGENDDNGAIGSS